MTMVAPVTPSRSSSPDMRAHCCPGSKMNADAERPALLGVLHHRARIVRRDDRQPAVAARCGTTAGRRRPSRRCRTRRSGCCPGRCCRRTTRRTCRRICRDQRRVDAGRLEPLPVLAEVLAGRRHQQRPLAEQRQRVGDVRRAAAAPLVHRVDEEAQADAVHVLRQEVLGELPRKRHQVVEGDRTGDDDVHDSMYLSDDRRELLLRLLRHVLGPG